MAILEKITYSPFLCNIKDGTVEYSNSDLQEKIEYVPRFFWNDHNPWREANSWLVDLLNTGQVNLKTITNYADGLLKYANFLEIYNIEWHHFPIRKSERCITVYRGYLIKLRDKNMLVNSTINSYMRICLNFYNWVKINNILNNKLELWKNKKFSFHYTDVSGFERTLSVYASDLRIPNRQIKQDTLEGGLLPISPSDRDIVLNIAKTHCSEELYWMLSIGFFTGLRIGSICDLKIQNLQTAIPDPNSPNLLLMTVGPSASPPVHTKFGVTGAIWIPKQLCNFLIEYAHSSRRLHRENRASLEYKNHLFLTKFGNPFVKHTNNFNKTINQQMSCLRKHGIKCGYQFFHKLRFHQTRCTFGTEITSFLLNRNTDTSLIIAIVAP